jgi:hypothetical protein
MLTLTGNDQFAQRFQREATIMMGFQHVNIVNYFDHFKTSNSYCMVMEFVDGCSVAQLLERHRYLDNDEALLILRDTVRALAFAHEKGVVHRDIKPANILISSKGEVKLTDFGIAHNQDVDTDGLTKEGMTLGTPSYMAPEQFRDAGSVDARADIYSAGVLLYECLTGRKPFAAPSLPEMLERIRKGRYEKLRKIRPESKIISRGIVRKAVRARPKRRYKDANRMLRRVDRYVARHNEDALRRQLASLVSERRQVERSGGGRIRRILRISGAAASGLGAAAVITLLWWNLAVSGYVPRPLLPYRLGALRVEVPLPDVPMPDPLVTVDLFRVGPEGIEPVKSELRGRRTLLDTLSIVPQRAEEERRILVVRPLVVTRGIYQAVVRIGDDIHTKSIQVSSLRDRRITMAGSWGISPAVTLSIPWEPKIGPVDVYWSVKKAGVGSSLNEIVTVNVKDDEGASYAVSPGTVLLNSGRFYEFTFWAPQYTPRVVEAWLKSGISRYFIDVDLLSEPATIALSSALPFRQPKLDGNRTYRQGGDEGGFRRLPILKDEPQEIILSPGGYRMTAGRGDAEAVLDIELEPGSRGAYRLIRNEDKTYQWLEVSE